MVRTTIDTFKNFDHAYERYLLAREKKIIPAVSQFEASLHRTDFKFGRFTIPTFMKPHFVTTQQARMLQTACDTLAQMIDRVVNLYFHDPVIRDVFSLSPEAEELVRIDPGYARSAVISRLDCFLDGESLKFMEFNCDSPAGMGYADCVENILLQVEELKDFFNELHLRRVNRAEALLKVLLEVYEEFGAYETPQIGIIDWKTVRTKPEFELLKRSFEEKGYKTVIADPRDLKLRGGKLYHGGFRIDLVYRRAIFSELLDRLRDVGDFIKAYRDRAVCVVNPLRSRIASSKALLSIFTNPGYDYLFSAGENKIKWDHIPWTRRVLDAEKFYGGKKIYLIDFLKDEKETLVLKPADSYGGKDVSLGCETRDEDWNRAIDQALKGNWVVQEFIRFPVFSVPVIVNNKIEFTLKKVNTGHFVFGGSSVSGFSRLSDDSVINVSRGGGLIPALVCEGEIFG
ncbi:MAG: hypothetical protein A3J52_01295 [Omnitrophica bacterium RIFCSPHIGHO2_02_FULL_49_9]|nr:MAG: hypothetical protein A3J52_01295 [Omnitrophica bacterium RIFCSPHIGHO2_02_FULL_49_9]